MYGFQQNIFISKYFIKQTSARIVLVGCGKRKLRLITELSKISKNSLMSCECVQNVGSAVNMCLFLLLQNN